MNSAIAEHALAIGIDNVQLYVYPPTLAYMLVPLTFFGISAASIIWKIVNVAALIGSGLILARLLSVPLLAGSLWPSAGLWFCFDLHWNASTGARSQQY